MLPIISFDKNRSVQEAQLKLFARWRDWSFRKRICEGLKGSKMDLNPKLANISDVFKKITEKMNLK